MVGGQVEGVLRVAIFVVVARDVDAFVPVQLARTWEQQVVGAYEQVPIEVWLNRLQHVLLQPVQIDGDFQEVLVLKVEQVEHPGPVECGLLTNPMTSCVGSWPETSFSYVMSL